MAAALGVLHLVLVWPVHGFLLSDTTGYLANARWFAGEAGPTWQGPSSFYHPLWSLLVSPLYVALDMPRHVQVGALLLNGALAVAVLPASYLLARRMFDLDVASALGAAAVAATYPAVVLLAGYEWGEALYQLLFVAFVLAVCSRRWIAVGALAAALNATHPRGLGVVAVALVYLVFSARHERRAFLGVAALLPLFLVTRIVDEALLEAIYSKTSAGVESDVLGRLTDPQLLWGCAKATIGQAWYLSVATFGLVPLGALQLAVRRRRGDLVVLAAGAATLAASALEMSDGTRVDHMIYGRYNEGAIAVFLVAGTAALAVWRRTLLRLLLLVSGSIALLALVLVVGRSGAAFTGNVSPLNVTGILVWHDSISEVIVARVTIGAIAVAAVVFVIARWRITMALVLTAAVFAGSSAAVQARTIDEFDDTFAEMTGISEVLRKLPRGSIGYDRAAYDVEAANFYQLELSDLHLRFVDSRRVRPQTTYVISGSTWDRGVRWGARLIYVEKGLYDQGLWVLPSPQQHRIVRAGAVLPSGPLPAAARRHHVEVDVPESVDTGSRTVVTVHLTHAGSGAGWRPFAVRLGARWFDDRGVQRGGLLAELDHTMLPGDVDGIRLPLIAPERPGRYTLRIGLLEEGVAWFAGDRSFSVDVR